VAGQHLVFALDLALLAPTLVLAGILPFRRTGSGWVMRAAVCLFGAVYQVNLMLAGVFQKNAGVPGVKAFPLEGIVLTLEFVIASAVPGAPAASDIGSTPGSLAKRALRGAESADGTVGPAVGRGAYSFLVRHLGLWMRP